MTLWLRVVMIKLHYIFQAVKYNRKKHILDVITESRIPLLLQIQKFESKIEIIDRIKWHLIYKSRI